MKAARFLSMLGIAALAFAIPFTAGATVKKEGAWPATDKVVDLEFEGKPLGPITLSAGVAALQPHQPSWAQVMRNADAALYAAKQAGRNRVLQSEDA